MVLGLKYPGSHFWRKIGLSLIRLTPRWIVPRGSHRKPPTWRRRKHLENAKLPWHHNHVLFGQAQGQGFGWRGGQEVGVVRVVMVVRGSRRVFILSYHYNFSYITGIWSTLSRRVLDSELTWILIASPVLSSWLAIWPEVHHNHHHPHLCHHDYDDDCLPF